MLYSTNGESLGERDGAIANVVGVVTDALPMVIAQAASTVVEGVARLPSISAVSVTSLNVEPGAYTALVARLMSAPFVASVPVAAWANMSSTSLIS